MTAVSEVNNEPQLSKLASWHPKSLLNLQFLFEIHPQMYRQLTLNSFHAEKT